MRSDSENSKLTQQFFLWRKLVTKLILIACILSSTICTPTPAMADSTHSTISISGNDTIDAYQGTGGLLLPGSYSGPAKQRQRVASCLGCRWKYSIYCDYGSDALCAHAVVTCPVGKIRYRVWFGREPSKLSVIGSVCWGSGKPATRLDVNRIVNDSAFRFVPRIRAGINPSTSTLVSVPIIVWSGQPVRFTPRSMTVAGQRVDIDARAMWLWQWGDGGRQWVATAGARYPRRDITHQYHRAGTYILKLTTVWQASYTVGGIGTFSVEGEVVRQQETLKIVVKPSRTVLATLRPA